MAEQKADGDVPANALKRQIFIFRNKVNVTLRVLGIADKEKVVTSGNFVTNGFEGLTLEQSKYQGVYFISKKSDPSIVLAVNNDGQVTTTGNRVAGPNGWEGFKFEPAGAERNVKYFIVSNNQNAKTKVLAIDDDGNVKTTNNRVVDGWEGLQVVGNIFI